MASPNLTAPADLLLCYVPMFSMIKLRMYVGLSSAPPLRAMKP